MTLLSDPPILDVRGLKKRFGALEVLKGIDLAVAAQELVFVIGPSGSGKSTLLRCCNRLEEPDGGSIRVDGVDLMDPKCDINAMRRRIGMVFQSFNLYPHMTALGNVTLALRKVIGRNRRDADAAGREALERVGLADKAGAYPAELSGGQQQRVAIARAIVTHPDVLLADEPTGNLDTERSIEIMELLTDLNRNSGITVLMVTHEAEMAAYAHTIIHFRDGLVESIETTEAPGVKG
jgi:polar amino acid transport system ATP-binding protein